MMTPRDIIFLDEIKTDIEALFADEHMELSIECHLFVKSLLDQIFLRQSVKEGWENDKKDQ